MARSRRANDVREPSRQSRPEPAPAPRNRLLRTLALLLAGGLRARLAEGQVRAHATDGYLAAHNGGVDVEGELTVALENRSGQAISVDEITQLEVVGADGRRRARTQAVAREVKGDGEVDFDRSLPAGATTTLRWSLLVDEVEAGEEVMLRGRLGTDRGALDFQTASFTVGAILA
jgi:hypothetical protein